MSAGAVLAAMLGGLAFGLGLVPSDPTARIEVTRGPSYEAAAVVEGEVGTSGTYTLVVDREGRSGRSRSQQGGAFSLSSPIETLSISRVGVSHGDVLWMELVVEWADGSTDTDTFSETVE